MQDRYYGKIWIYVAQLVIFGLLGVFGLTMGLLFWTEVLHDANDEPRPETIVPLGILGLVFLALAVLAAFNIAARRAPLVRCYREGLECRLIGATSLDEIPLVPMPIRIAWSLLTLEGFRVRRVRVLWSRFQGAQVDGVAMAYVLTIFGSLQNVRTGRISTRVSFGQIALRDHPEDVADALNDLAADPERRRQLPAAATQPRIRSSASAAAS